MNINSIPPNLDWIKARAECSIIEVFKQLEVGVRDDTAKAQALVLSKETIRFSVSKVGSSRFDVMRVDDPITPIGHSVHFTCKRNEIVVSEDAEIDDVVKMTATLTLTNDGQCKLKVGDQELYQWQFRRMALEQLFFKR